MTDKAAISSSFSDPEIVSEYAEKTAQLVPALFPNEDETVLRESGFTSIDVFYAAFTFKGWVCNKPKNV